MRKWSASAGVGLIELLFGIAIAMLILGALVLFVGRGFGVGRENFEQARITDDARFNMERMAEVIRNARDLDVDLDDEITIPPDQHWLWYADSFQIVLFSDVDNDSDAELVRYFLLQGETDLKRGVTQPRGFNSYDPLNDEVVTTVATSIRNQEQQVPLFNYYGLSGSVERVGINMLVDVQPDRYPDPALVQTQVTPRRKYVN